jgi:hypothetical protein
MCPIPPTPFPKEGGKEAKKRVQRARSAPALFFSHNPPRDEFENPDFINTLEIRICDIEYTLQL